MPSERKPKVGRPCVRMPVEDRAATRQLIEEVLERSESLCMDSSSDRAVLFGRLVNALGVDG